MALLQRRLKAAGHGNTGARQLPEPGPVKVVLMIEEKAYCAEYLPVTLAAPRPAR